MWYPVTFQNPAITKREIEWQPTYRDPSGDVVEVNQLSEIPAGVHVCWSIYVRRIPGGPRAVITETRDRDQCLNLLVALFGRTGEDPDGEDDFVHIQGCDGVLTVNREGVVIDRTPHEGDEAGQVYPEILRFDVDEYREHYGKLDDTDILLIGYWTNDGQYEPPDEDFRMMSEQAQQRGS